jgi:hypothetical protein
MSLALIGVSVAKFEVYLIRYVNREGVEVRPRAVSLANDVQTRLDYCNRRTCATGVRAEAVPIELPDLDGDFDGQWNKMAGSKDRKRMVSQPRKWRLVCYRVASGNETSAHCDPGQKCQAIRSDLQPHLGVRWSNGLHFDRRSRDHGHARARGG